MTPIKYWMDNGLKKILNSIAYNIPNDWDSIILISGSGMVRVGKSVLGQQIGHYLAYKLGTSWTIENIVFTGQELMDKAKKAPKNTVFVYDEGRQELDTKKVMEDITKTLLDFFSEAGMYNHCIIIILPEFFDLPKGIAINRSELLINVYRDRSGKKDDSGEDVIAFERGFFKGYHRTTKKKLYIFGKKNFNDYDCVKQDFVGKFPNIFTIDKDSYLAKKKDYLARDRTRQDKDDRFNIILKVLCNHISASQAEKELRSHGLKISNDTIMRHAKLIS
jgi:hypothetical protein